MINFKAKEQVLSKGGMLENKYIFGSEDYDKKKGNVGGDRKENLLVGV